MAMSSGHPTSWCFNTYLKLCVNIPHSFWMDVHPKFVKIPYFGWIFTCSFSDPNDTEILPTTIFAELCQIHCKDSLRKNQTWLGNPLVRHFKKGFCHLKKIFSDFGHLWSPFLGFSTTSQHDRILCWKTSSLGTATVRHLRVLKIRYQVTMKNHHEKTP